MAIWSRTNCRRPWENGSATQVEVAVYAPPGYDSNSSLKYPTLYEVPWNVATWQDGVDLTGALDTLIDRGTMPPAIVVYVDAGRGPYPDSERANSYDGRGWYDRFVAQTVVPWVDSHYRTIVCERRAQ
jgi:enterochelin esterase-like enzyme